MAKNKSFNKLVAGTMTAAMVAGVVAPVAASAAENTFKDVPAGHWSEKAINDMAAKKIIAGQGDGTFGFGQDVTRAQVATFMVKAKDLSLTTDAPSFSDVAADNMYAKFIATAEKNKVMSGLGDGKFGPDEKLTRAQMAQILVNAYGFKADENNKKTFNDIDGLGWATAKSSIETLASLGIVSGKGDSKFDPNGTVTREEAAQFIYNAMNYKPAETAEAKVESVKATNATQVEVKFNKAVDSTDAKVATQYSINGTNPASVSLSDDGKTATLTFASASDVEVTDGVVVVSPVKLASDADQTTAKYTSVLTYKDTVKPEIASVTSVTKDSAATTLTVTTTEPIQSALAKVDGSYYTVVFGGSNTGTITGLNLDASKSHTLELINLTDKATTPNVTVSTSKTFNVTVDAAAPTAKLSAYGDKQILVTFSKPMDVISVDAAFGLNVGVADESLAAVNHTAVATAVAGSNDTQFLIPITDTLYANKSSRTLTVVLPSTIQDKLGNSLVAGTQTVTLSKDTVKPVATGYKVVKDSNGLVTDIEVNFSEGLKANPATSAPSIVNMNGVDVTTTLLGGLTAKAVTAGDTKVVFHAATPAKLTGKYAFSFGSQLVTDQSEVGNQSDAFNYTIDFGAGTTSFDLPSNPTSANNVITVAFGRAVKGGAVANSATDVANYTLGGKPLPEGTKIVLNGAQDTAKITLPAGSIDKTDASAVFTVANVMSQNGELVNSKTSTLGVLDNVKPILNSAVLNSDGTLTIGFSEALSAAPAVTDFTVTENGATTATALVAGTDSIAVGTGLNAGKYVLTVKNIQADAQGIFVDADGDGTRNNGEVALSSLKLSTATTTTATDNASNVLVAGTTITVK
ncbi:S-layer homology domain-containing protein [Bacillus sp. S13(2024)]|uniref:S-layer homology domain-containing protein n=1 Tax=unclassified Bacillus (in: firmicutes) TaxID=185979 RepID=UPI003D1ED1B6